jgi:ATP-binding cassette, subfamily B, multidrug efflux pump
MKNGFAMSSEKSMRSITLLDEEEVSPSQTIAGDGNNKLNNGEITFKNVSFSYDGHKEVLKNISFTAKPGETVALVGHTGSGKSSIINLLMRFYEFSSWEILVDGKSIKLYPMNELGKDWTGASESFSFLRDDQR